MIIDQFVNIASKLNQRSANPPHVSIFKYLVITFTINLYFDHLRVIIDRKFAIESHCVLHENLPNSAAFILNVTVGCNMPLLTLLQTLCFILSLNTSWSDGNIPQQICKRFYE